MKKCCFLLSLATMISGLAFGQQPNVGCLDKVILQRATEVKLGLEKQGMTIYRDAMIGMESETAFPIEVKLEKGQSYQLLFVGNADAQRTTMELYDGDDKQLGDKHIGKNSSPGYVLMAFAPVNPDTYLIMLTQRLKKASSCGSFTIMVQNDGKNTPASTQDGPAGAARTNTNVGGNSNQQPNSNRYLGTPAKKN
jgi:hypothetical protein